MDEFKLSKPKSALFKLSIGIQILLMFFLFLNGKSHLQTNPTLAYTEIILSVLGCIAQLLIYFFRKMGVYLYASVLFVGIFVNPIKSDLIFTSFFFIGVGLTLIMTRWNLFK